jgi:hypothetical protein
MMLSLQDLLLVPLELAVAVQWEVPIHISQTVVDRNLRLFHRLSLFRLFMTTIHNYTVIKVISNKR